MKGWISVTLSTGASALIRTAAIMGVIEDFVVPNQVRVFTGNGDDDYWTVPLSIEEMGRRIKEAEADTEPF